MRLALIIFSIILPLLTGAYMSDSRKVDTHKPVSSSNIIDLRERTKSSIDDSSEIHPQVALSPIDSIPDFDIPNPLFQLEISACGNQSGNANLRVGDSVIGIISAGTIVDLTGSVSGEWVEVLGVHWPIGENYSITGAGWIHKCWVTPESMVTVEPENDSQTKPLGLLSRRGGRSFRSASRPRKSYMQSTGELAGYVGRDLVDYALLYPRIAAYQLFWNFATDSRGGPVSSSASGSYSTFRDQEVSSQLYPDLHRIHPQIIDRLGIVPGEPLMPWQQTLLKEHL